MEKVSNYFFEKLFVFKECFYVQQTFVLLDLKRTFKFIDKLFLCENLFDLETELAKLRTEFLFERAFNELWNVENFILCDICD